MNRLTAAFVRTVKPTDRLRRYGDGNGLYLLVKPGPRGGGKSWVQRLAINGTRRDLGLGSAELVTLAEAREAAHDNRRRARAGADPRAERRRISPTFAEAAEEVIAMHRPGWKRGGGSEAQWRSSFERYAYPRIGRKPVHAIDAADLMAVLQPLWIEKHETARRLRLRIGQVMRWAIGQGHRTDNPAGDAVGAALPKVDARPVHQRALPHAEVGAALAAVRRTGAAPAAKLAFEFMVLCAVRSGEARGATWDEIDLDRAVWTLPAARMKAGREHRVPLSPRALGVLREAAALRRGELVFPAPSTGRALTVAALGDVLRAAGVDAVPHGFRSSFRDWAAECTDAPHEVCELALAHVNGNRVEAAYRRTDLFDRRRVLMTDWAAYVAWPIPPPPVPPPPGSRRRSRDRGRQGVRPHGSSLGLRPGRGRSAVVQLVSTGEALMERRIAEIPPGGERLEAGRGHRVRLPGDVVQRPPSTSTGTEPSRSLAPHPHPRSPAAASARVNANVLLAVC